MLNISNRNYIFNLFNKLKDLNYTDILLNDLEQNVKRAYGEFPKDFLKVGQSPEMTRLIQLEERWREAEEREAEQPNTQNPKRPLKAEKTIKDLVRDNALAEAITVALKKPNLSKDDEKALILLQSRLAALEKRKNEGTIEPATYEAQLNELKKSLLDMSDE